MSQNLPVKQKVNMSSAIEEVLIKGDLSVLKPEERIQYYKQVCETVGLNPLTKPFDYLQLNGKLVLYANKGCAEQLRAVQKISLTIQEAKVIEGVYIVIAQAEDESGRKDSATGAVPITGLKGDALANAYMKAETKAKRRVTLSICGLNVLDASEIDSIPADRGKPFLEQPGPHDGNTNAGPWKFRVGQYRGKTIDEVYNDPHPKCGPKGLSGYVAYLDAQEAKGPLSDDAKEMREQIVEFLAGVEGELAAPLESKKAVISPIKPISSTPKPTLEPEFMTDSDVPF